MSCRHKPWGSGRDGKGVKSASCLLLSSELYIAKVRRLKCLKNTHPWRFIKMNFQEELMTPNFFNDPIQSEYTSDPSMF
jgi:hypothetical protein